jgi:mRNA-degrading endonuclease RelE of RelBE toxin-antitoxin system
MKESPEFFYQVTFSDQSMHELNKLDTLMQLQLVETLSSLSLDKLQANPSHLGVFNRNGKTFYRLRAGDYRIYFEVSSNVLYSNYILHQHTWADFVFRCKLPFKEEDMIEKDQSFWKYLENLKK